ncbi:pro-apoptotic serine protease [Purpureocillium lavendulum]|uniref:Pro-apoptotic serine protease n=1 Tax=Purpureocillium lavendulum TaxID=1247861 RepID=A0AB34G2R6_9HYPO|nr:pro-apoptotic serine protease [Purpureocillium lavendulum]
MSGGNSTSVDEARLEQPRDAVPMETIEQSSVPEKDALKAVDGPASAQDAGPESTDSHAAPADPERPADAETDVHATTPKGKDRDDDAPTPPSKERSDSMAIGPAQDDIRAVTQGATDNPVCNITLLLTSGSRHPYKLDAKYLARRNVTMPEETESGQPDPFSISVYTLKELILREWRSDWEAKPASPSSIRLIHFGKLLDDKEQLKKYQFSTEAPNVIHMSIRPADLDEEEPKSGSKHLPSGSGDGQRSRGGSNCCVIL